MNKIRKIKKGYKNIKETKLITENNWDEKNKLEGIYFIVFYCVRNHIIILGII